MNLIKFPRQLRIAAVIFLFLRMSIHHRRSFHLYLIRNGLVYGVGKGAGDVMPLLSHARRTKVSATFLTDVVVQSIHSGPKVFCAL